MNHQYIKLFRQGIISALEQILGSSSNVKISMIVGPLSRVRPRNGILALVVVLVLVVLVVPLRSEFIGEL